MKMQFVILPSLIVSQLVIVVWFGFCRHVNNRICQNMSSTCTATFPCNRCMMELVMEVL